MRLYQSRVRTFLFGLQTFAYEELMCFTESLSKLVQLGDCHVQAIRLCPFRRIPRMEIRRPVSKAFLAIVARFSRIEDLTAKRIIRDVSEISNNSFENYVTSTTPHSWL